MKLKILNKEILKKAKEKSFALGVFDGVHLGHNEIIKRAKIAITFDPHPQLTSRNKLDPIKMLTTLEERKMLIDNLLVLQFSDEVAGLNPEEFVKKVLIDELGVEKVVVGYDYRFGFRRSGCVEDLREYAERYGFVVEIVPPFRINEIPVKSSTVRRLIMSSSFEEAKKLLGRDYFLMGEVIKGKGIGKKIGYPTANLEVPDEKLLPARGLYAGEVEAKGKNYKAVIYFGVLPSLSSEENKLVYDEIRAHGLEVYLLNFKGDLCGEKIIIKFKRHIRNEMYFEDIKDLKKQIQNDLRKI
jgi:riboflavin kinase/FMN adenylyltransferase